MLNYNETYYKILDTIISLDSTYTDNDEYNNEGSIRL